MSQNEPKLLVFRPASRWICASLLAVALAGCEQSPREPQPDPNSQAIAPTPVASATQPRALPVLTRGDLVSAIGQAASDYAGGVVHENADPLVGRSFSVSVAFGCSGPVANPTETGDAPGLASWAWGPDRQTIELQMTPGDWAGTNLIAGSADAPDWEAVEGFWISRPWLASEACPQVRADPLAAGTVSPSPQSVGLAAVFEAGGSRLGRRNGRAYSYTVRAEGGAPLAAPTEGFRLVLEGRTNSFPDGRAIRCRASGPDQRPVCVVATILDRVAFQTADGSVLTQWRPG